MISPDVSPRGKSQTVELSPEGIRAVCRHNWGTSRAPGFPLRCSDGNSRGMTLEQGLVFGYSVLGLGQLCKCPCVPAGADLMFAVAAVGATIALALRWTCKCTWAIGRKARKNGSAQSTHREHQTNRRRRDTSCKIPCAQEP